MMRIKINPCCFHGSRALVVSLPLLLLSPLAAVAGGGFGSVWATSTTDDSITVDWSDPSGNYRHCGAPTYQVCAKEAGDLVDTCNNPPYPIVTTSKPYTFAGLAAGDKYKIKIYTLAEKKSFGKFRNCEYRKVGTLTQRTDVLVPPPSYGHLVLSGAGFEQFSATASFSNPGILDAIRVCYKTTWLLVSLKFACSNLTPPFSSPPQNASRGFLEVAPAVSSVTFTFLGLKPCRQYKVWAFGLLTGGGSVVIGDGKIHTEGSCGIFGQFSSIVAGSIYDDFDETAQAYLVDAESHIASVYGVGLITYLTGIVDPSTAADLAIFNDDEEGFTDEAELLSWLVEERPDMLETWQSDPMLSSDFTLVGWLEDNEPAMLEQILLDNELLSLPALGLAGVAALVLGFVAFGRLAILRRGVGRRGHR